MREARSTSSRAAKPLAYLDTLQAAVLAARNLSARSAVPAACIGASLSLVDDTLDFVSIDNVLISALDMVAWACTGWCVLTVSATVDASELLQLEGAIMRTTRRLFPQGIHELTSRCWLGWHGLLPDVRPPAADSMPSPAAGCLSPELLAQQAFCRPHTSAGSNDEVLMTEDAPQPSQRCYRLSLAGLILVLSQLHPTPSLAAAASTGTSSAVEALGAEAAPSSFAAETLVLSPFPRVYSPVELLRLLLPPCTEILQRAAGKAVSGSAVHMDAERGEEQGDGSSSAATPADALAIPEYAAGMVALRVLAALGQDCPPGSMRLPRSPLLRGQGEQEGEEDWAGGSSATSSGGDGGVSFPLEVHLLQSLLTLLAHAPDTRIRDQSLSVLHLLLTCMPPYPRITCLHILLESCPYPHIRGLLIDRCRAEVAAALKQRAAAAVVPAGGAARVSYSPALDRPLIDTIMSAVRGRIRGGLLGTRQGHFASSSSAAAATGASSSSCSSSSAAGGRGMSSAARIAGAGTDIHRCAEHLSEHSDVDLALLSLLRLMLMVMERERQAGAASPAASGTPSPSLPSSSTCFPFTHEELSILLDGYCRPLMSGLVTVERELREEQGIHALGPHPTSVGAALSAATLDAGSAASSGKAPSISAATSAASAAASAAAGGGTAQLSLAPAPGPPSGSVSYHLSRAFLLDAALVPVMGPLEDAVRASRSSVGGSSAQ